MAKAVFDEQVLGDGLVWIGTDYERTAALTRRVLWSERADVDDASPNFLWRVKVVVWAKRTDAVALSAALETLAGNLTSEKADLKIFADDAVTLLRTYPDCRFDAMARREGPRDSRRNFEDDVAFTFTTSEKAE